MSKLAVLFLILSTGNIFAFGSKQTVPGPGPVTIPSFSAGTVEDSSARPVHQGYEQEQSGAEKIMKALASAYPRQIDRAEFRNGDWAIRLRETWYYYAGGKILPENLLESASAYSVQPFYSYQSELPTWKEPSPEEEARYREISNNRSKNPPRRSPHFFDDLLRVHNRDESYQRVKSFRFLGKQTLVHYLIMEELALVEEQILAIAKTDPQVQAWINGIGTVEAWNWRNIAETQSRSYHSYGLAIDLLPKSLGSKETYWLWAARKRTDWWNISYNGRFHPPAAIIKAFETYGFVWGGKWLFFDTMHFEYRPEILILSGMPVETSR
jgi:hypothetical protein